MPLKDWLTALVVIMAWGVNFVVIKLALTEIPPMLLGGMRFTLVAIPAIFFIPKPALPWRIIVLYGATISLGQFTFLFTAMYQGMPAGLASLVLQSQAFFTVLIAAVLLGEPIRRQNVIGVTLAGCGLALIHQAAAPGSVPLVGLLLTLLAAFSWSCGNIVVKVAGKTDMLKLVIWGAMVPPIPFYLLSWQIEGWPVISHSLRHIGWVGILTLLYLAVVATTLGFVLWGRLLNRHPVSKVAPLSLLVPVVGLVSAALLLGEKLVWLQWLGGLVVLLGLAINTFGLSLRGWRRSSVAAQR